MILKQNVALLLQRTLDQTREHTQHAGQHHADMDLGVHHVDRRIHRFAHGGDLKVELVAGPAGLNLRPARNMVGELVHVVSDAAAGFVLAEAVGQVDVDGLTHICDVGPCSALFKPCGSPMLLTMRSLASLLMVIAMPAEAQTVPVTTAPVPAQPPALWNPA